MGKSPGRWIKTVFFGKKHSKSSFPKSTKHDKKDGAQNAVEYVSGNSPVISNPHVVAAGGADGIELENSAAQVPCATSTRTSISVNQGMESQSVSVSLPISDAEMRRQGEAAAKVQAAFRGFLARRAFWALKGIIRLQALIRGHLVRRQAVATLRCMKAVVKLQALARGQRVRLSSTYPEICRKYNIEGLQNAKPRNLGAKLQLEEQTTNAYIRKLVQSLPTAMPLSLQYDLAEPNSAGNWLERWSLSRFWVPPAHPRKVSNIKAQKKQGSSQTADNEPQRSKRSFRNPSVAANGDNGVLASIELDKPKKNPRKITNHPTEAVQEQLPQNEFERVKRNLRKVSTSVPPASEKSEMEADKPIIDSAPLNVSVKEIAKSVEVLPTSDTTGKQGLVEAPTKMLTADYPMNVMHDDHPLLESHSLENGAEAEITPLPPTHEEMGSREDESGKENQKVRKRRSLPPKQEYTENISQNTPAIPSYMAATQSAKAKLRGHGSARFSEDGTEQGYVRRHSLPASTNGKLSSMSPRMQKPSQVNAKDGNKTNRSVQSSRDEKGLQPGWRR